MKYSVAALFLGAGLAVHAQGVISWNYDVYSTINPTTSPNANQAGVVLAPDWNDAYYMNNTANTGANLMDNTGTQTTVGYTLAHNSGNWAIAFSHPGQDADGSYNKELLNGYMNANSPETIALSGIQYGAYNIYVYFSSDTAGRTGTVGIGSTTYDFSALGGAETSGANALLTQTTDTTGANPSADYAVFSGLTGASQTISLDIPGYGGIAGFQIVATPEPGTLALAGLGGLLAVGLRRRKI